MKSARVRWMGYDACMGEKRNPHGVLLETLSEKKSFGWPSIAGRIVLKMHIKELGSEGMKRLSSAMTAISGGLLLTGKQACGYHKMWRPSSLATELLYLFLVK
jgi:hypothetical protein